MACDIDLQLGKRLRRRRQMLGLTQKDVARVMGISCQQIQKYECGVDCISAARLWRLSTALETSPGYFFGAADEPAPEARTSDPEAGPTAVDLSNLVGLYNRLPERHRRQVFTAARSLSLDAELASA